MARVRVYSTRWCGYCVRAKSLLESRGIEYEEISLDADPSFRQKLFDLTGGWTGPADPDRRPADRRLHGTVAPRPRRPPRRRAGRLTFQALTVGAIPGAATGGSDLVDRSPTALTRATFAVVNAKPVLHAAPSTVRGRVIAQARALPPDRGFQGVLDRPCQTARARPRRASQQGEVDGPVPATALRRRRCFRARPPFADRGAQP